MCREYSRYNWAEWECLSSGGYRGLAPIKRNWVGRVGKNNACLAMPRHLLLPHAPNLRLSCPCEHECYCAVSFRAHRRDLLPAANFKKDSFPSKKDSSPASRHRSCLKRIWKRIPPGRVGPRKRMLAGRVVMRKRMETNIPRHYAGALTNQYPSASGGLFRRGRGGVEVRQVY